MFAYSALAVAQSMAGDFGPDVSFGGVCGFASGFASKKAGKVAMLVRLILPLPAVEESARLIPFQSGPYVARMSRRKQP
jgi:hypothetical protein